MKLFLIRSLLTAAVVGATAYVAEAGPLGIFGPRRCQCSPCECKPCEKKAGPIEKVVTYVADNRPIAMCVGGVCHSVGSAIESRPIVTFIQGCANGQCPKR